MDRLHEERNRRLRMCLTSLSSLTRCRVCRSKEGKFLPAPDTGLRSAASCLVGAHWQQASCNFIIQIILYDEKKRQKGMNNSVAGNEFERII